MRTVLGILAGLATVIVGIFLFNKVFVFILSLGFIQNILGLHSIIEATVIFILTLGVYGVPYGFAMLVAIMVSRNAIAPITMSVVYVAVCLYIAYFFITIASYWPVITATIICALNAGYQIAISVKAEKKARAELTQE